MPRHANHAFFVAALVAAAACLAPSAHARDAPRAAGTFQLAEGDILVEGKDGKARAPAAGGEVFEGDTITTFASAEIHLQMADGASLIVRENSKLTIAEYVADGGEDDRSLIDLAKGALRSITGWIGQYNRANYRIRTPLVTIGVRGTDHEPSHLLEGDPRGEAGSYDKVNEGRTFMQGAEGIVEVPANRVVF
ncbi:MAG: FecR family protein, partial [Burkholderiales bacterium]